MVDKYARYLVTYDTYLPTTTTRSRFLLLIRLVASLGSWFHNCLCSSEKMRAEGNGTMALINNNKNNKIKIITRDRIIARSTTPIITTKASHHHRRRRHHHSFSAVVHRPCRSRTTTTALPSSRWRSSSALAPVGWRRRTPPRRSCHRIVIDPSNGIGR
jgi:hypothetical protein